MNNAIRLKRLEHFVEVMKAVPKKKFHIGSWIEEEHFDEPLKVKIPKSFVRLDCKSVACALGWAALDKKFRKAGLKWIQAEDRYGDVAPRLVYKDFNYQLAGQEFFGIDGRESDDLFFDGHYNEIEVLPRHVIKKLKALIKKYKKQTA